MAWFRRSKEGISAEGQKKDMPDGMWTKCPGCNEIVHKKQLEQNFFCCPKCATHFRIGSKEYFDILLDEGTFKEMDKKMRSVDVLNFVDTKPYDKRLEESMKKTSLMDAIRTGLAEIEKIPVAVACMDFAFIGGSMGSVVGEKIARLIDAAMKKETPLIIISSSGGARMMESALSLMQLAKTSAKLAQLSDAGIPYISVLTDPTTGGVTASYAMLGDLHIAEPGALIGFAGPRVIKQAVGKDLPKGFQRSEFLLDKGFVDLIVHRKDLKSTIAKMLRLFQG
jgi:acetyl-CoA carboxylase carboxyl transferase subunit beta